MIVEANAHAHRSERLPALTQDETAQVMGMRGYPMSRARVQQIEMKALRKLARNKAIAKLLPEIIG